MKRYDDSKYEAGKVIAALKSEKGAEHVQNAMDCEKTETIFRPKETNNQEGIKEVVLIYLKRKEKLTVMEAIEELSSHPDVVYVEPDYICECDTIPDDPLFGSLWGMEKIRAPLAWDFETGSREVIVGVLDSGADGNHPDLRSHLLIPRENRFADFRDISGHGTHVAGTIGAIGNNHIGVVGVCWSVGLAIFKLGTRTFDLAAILAAIDFAARNNIPILNNSWGGTQFSHILKFAISQYSGLFIAAAGNSAVNNDLHPHFPAAYDLTNIISVAATNPNNVLAPFSNYGVRSVDIAAPGANILSTDIDGGYSNMSGTSMSAPHVTGAAALLKSFRPRLTTQEMKHIILSTAQRLPSLRGRVATGGMLDVNAMLEKARRL